jgi:UDP-glucose 4-epimerase
VNVLITGVGGLIGSRLAEHILKTKPDVTVVGIDDLSGGYISNIPMGVDFHQMNLTDTIQLEEVFKDTHFDIVYHFAAYAAEALSPFIRQFNYTNNLVATAGIVNMCIKYGAGRLVFTSSMAVYGEGTPPFDETSPRNPIDPYGVAKTACEQDIEIAGVQHGLDYCIIRPHNVYGRNQNVWDSYRNVLGIWMFKKIHNDPFTIFGDGSQRRAFSSIDDALEPFWRAGTLPEASKQIINLGGIKEVTIAEAAAIVSEVVGGSEIVTLPPRHEVKYAYPTYQKSVDLLGFEHNVDLFEGTAAMWEWVQKQPLRNRFIWDTYELDKGLYPYWSQNALKPGYYK